MLKSIPPHLSLSESSWQISFIKQLLSTNVALLTHFSTTLLANLCCDNITTRPLTALTEIVNLIRRVLSDIFIDYLFLIYQELHHDQEHVGLRSSHTGPGSTAPCAPAALSEEFQFGKEGNALGDAEQHDIHKDDKRISGPEIGYVQ